MGAFVGALVGGVGELVGFDVGASVGSLVGGVGALDGANKRSIGAIGGVGVFVGI